MREETHAAEVARICGAEHWRKRSFPVSPEVFMGISHGSFVRSRL